MSNDTPAASGNYAKHLMRGSAWMIAARWAVRLIGLLSTIILARLLAPADFGIVAMALIAAGLLEAIAYAGVDLALMRQGNDTREHYDTAWTVQLIQGAFVAVLLLLAAPLAANYFNEPRAAAVVRLLALKSLIDGTQNIGIVAFRKELDFAKEFRFTLYAKLLNFVIVVGAAFAFRNYWALAVGMTSAGIVSVVLSYIMHPYRPRLSLAKHGEIWSFSQWLIISRIGAFLNRRTDEFVVGGMAGTSAMGNYHLASEISTMPSSELVMPMRRAMFPSLAKVTHQPEEFANAVLNSFSAVAALCLAVAFGLMSVAPEVVHVFLGKKWEAAIELIRWLALFGGFSALVLVLEVPLWVSGRTQLSAFQTWLELAILVPIVWYATHRFGIEGAAAARMGVAVVMVPIMMYLAARARCVSFGRMVAAVWRPLAAALIMALVLALIPFAELGSHMLALLCKVALGTLLYVGLVAAMWILSGRPNGFEAALAAQAKHYLARRSIST